MSLLQAVTRTWVERSPVDVHCLSNGRTSTEADLDRIQTTLFADLLVTVINTTVQLGLIIEYFVFLISTSPRTKKNVLSLSPHLATMWLPFFCKLLVTANDSLLVRTVVADVTLITQHRKVSISFDSMCEISCSLIKPSTLIAKMSFKKV